MTYLEKLKHPNWQKKRLLILERDNFTCRYCGDKETELQIHHLKYYGNPWEAKDEYLLTLCKECHHLITNLPGLEVISISKQKFGLGEFIIFVKHQKRGRIYIEVINRLKDNYKSIIVFNQNGTSINKLINLNNS